METPILRRDTALQGEICMDPVRQRKKLETWRNGLLDLGRRNPPQPHDELSKDQAGHAAHYDA